MAARLGEGLAGELFLAAGEVEVQRALGCAARANELIQAGGVIALGVEEVGRGVDEALAGVGARCRARTVREL